MFRGGDELVNRFQFARDHKGRLGREAVVPDHRHRPAPRARAWRAGASKRAVRAREDAALAARIRALQDPAQGGDRA
ncbi:hypothetical protein MANAM107_14420 [Actinomyces capricornis]|uniref:Uncharacterized protein n=1 Tax=Actinomyces capricornis TaxID=2755559 RepID=A0ABN6K8C0_9ACTO|nr:hypothetical protein MANAM107_14420 [Actinomyces capricornis]